MVLVTFLLCTNNLSVYQFDDVYFIFHSRRGGDINNGDAIMILHNKQIHEEVEGGFFIMKTYVLDLLEEVEEDFFITKKHTERGGGSFEVYISSII